MLQVAWGMLDRWRTGGSRSRERQGSNGIFPASGEKPPMTDAYGMILNRKKQCECFKGNGLSGFLSDENFSGMISASLRWIEESRLRGMYWHR